MKDLIEFYKQDKEGVVLGAMIVAVGLPMLWFAALLG